jgi:aryl-alcohol dehydrogenase-like predicted oxidoreductase
MKSTNLTFKIGGEVEINRLGYGAMRLTGKPGNYGPYHDWQGGVELLRKAVELGVQHFDSARPYGPHHNERLVADAIAHMKDKVFIATKGGINKDGPGGAYITRDGRPETLKNHIETSLDNLKRDVIDLYYLHAPDPKVDFAESINALAEARREGKIRFIGVSNVSLEQLKVAMTIAPIAAVQNRHDPLRDGAEALIDFTMAHGIAFVPWGPLGTNPFDREAPLAKGGVAGDPSLTPAQRALQALLNRAPNILPIPGTTSINHLTENVEAWQKLAQAEVAHA